MKASIQFTLETMLYLGFLFIVMVLSELIPNYVSKFDL